MGQINAMAVWRENGIEVNAMLVWSDESISECPGCGATIAVGILSLAATCKIDGYYYVDVNERRGWYSSRAAFERGDPPIRGWK